MIFGVLATIPSGHPRYPKAKWVPGETSLTPMCLLSVQGEPVAWASLYFYTLCEIRTGIW